MDNLPTVTIALKDYDELRKIRREATVVQYQTFNGERHIYQGKDELISDLVKKINESEAEISKRERVIEEKSLEILKWTLRESEYKKELIEIKSKWYYKLFNRSK